MKGRVGVRTRACSRKTLGGAIHSVLDVPPLRRVVRRAGGIV